ncbi:MAG: gliding motility-associated ABC transporter permease subunit GldF [Bacteroidia bacterium]|nr:gliding motility-associated ABC transporter permease subunit GldF [Bacteroidia bacterium]MDW8235193.1 gliding motility-associated ABC transporter permease subunit GldF [Bacteroidia bacterium]
MLALWRKEVFALLYSLIAYITWAIFLVGTGLFLWVFSGSVVQTGMAEMDSFFSIAPWFLLFLAPALTMRSFSEEFRTGTYELLATAPIPRAGIVLAKFLAVTTVLFFALVPTFIFYASLSWLAQPRGALDHGAIQGAYVGLFSVGLALSALGIWASTLTPHTIIAFLIGLFLGFLWLMGWEFASELPIGRFWQTFLAQMSLMEHYRSLSRGVLDSRDILYFLTLIGIALALAHLQLSRRHL